MTNDAIETLGSNPRPISLEKRQGILQARFTEASERYAADPAEAAQDGYDSVQDWFETTSESFRKAKLPVPERPGWMRTDDWDIDGLVALADQLGRKLEPQDVTPGLRRFATEWLRALPLPIDFEYLRDMRHQIDPKMVSPLATQKPRPLSVPQAKGVLNCAVAAARRTPKAAPKTPATPPVELEAGIYFKGDVVYKVQKAVHGSGHAYAKRLVVPDATFDMQHGAGSRKGRFEYDKGAIRSLTPDDRMTLEQAKAFGAIYGVCCSCGATLTDEDSIEAGIGPICRGKLA